MDSEVGKLDIVINANADKVAAAVDKANAKLDSLAARAKASSDSMVAANKSTLDSFGSISSGLQKTASSIDSLGKRTDDLLGKQHTAWLAIGAVVGGSTQGMITKITNFVDRVNSIPDAIDAGFKPLIQAQILANDTSALTNATLEKQIAIIEKKPVNGAAIAFAESEIEVDHLAASLEATNTAMEKVLSDNHIARWKLIFGKGGTASTEGTINSFNQQISDLGYEKQVDVHDNQPALAAQDEVERRGKLDAAHRTYQQGIRDNADRPGVDNSANRRDFQNADSIVLGEIRAYQEADQQRTDKARLDQDEAAQRAKQNAAEAAAAAAKAQADLFRAAEQQRDKLRINGPLSPKAEFEFFQGSDAAGTPQAQARMGALASEGATRSGETIKRFRDDQKRQSAENSTGQLEAMKAIVDVTRLQDDATEKHSNSLAEMNAIVEESADKLKEQQIGFDLSRGAITRHDATVQLAALHLSQYQAQLAKLDQEARNDAANKSLTPDQLQENQDRRNQQRSKIIGDYSITASSDANEAANTTALGAASSALGEFIAQTKDSAAQIKNFTDSSLGAFNDQVIKSLTTRDHENNIQFRNLGAGIFRSAAGVGLSKFEGLGLSALGLGGGKKPTGAAGDPLHVVMEQGLASGGLGALNSLFSKAGGASGIASSAVTDAGDFAASDAFSGGASALSDIIPFFGDGGAISAGTMAVVGDRGPELFMPGTSGTIIPNHALGGSSGTGDIHFHSGAIDARGSNDPAAVAMQINRAIRQAAPHIAAASIAAQRDRSRRMPSIKR